VRRRDAVSRLGAALALSLCAVWPRSEIAAQDFTRSSAALHDLASIGELQAVFDADREKTRVVLLLSPT
jgi:hypothetical protein